MELKDFKGNVLTRVPFKRIIPFGAYLSNGDYANGLLSNFPITRDGSEIDMSNFDRPFNQLIPQAEFLREYFPSGHKINDKNYYPDKLTKIKYNDKEVWAEEAVSRCAFPFQYIITTKQLIHLCGNPVQHKSSIMKPTDAQKEALVAFKQGWLDKNMEIAWYNCAKSEKITGDSACLFYYETRKDKRIIRWRTMSYLDGDTLFCHDDPSNGRIFVRKFLKVNDEGRPYNYIEIWDDVMAYRFVSDGSSSGKKNPYANIGLDGYTLEQAMHHGFSKCPVAYKRSMIGACWSMSQSNIDAYEMSVSQLMENNKAFAFPILFIKSQDAEIEGMANGRPYAIHATGEHDDARLLTKTDASESFRLQLETQLKNIFLGSFTVTPPEVKSGDLPGVAIKLIYSPALELAMSDAREWDLFIDDMVDLFKEGYSMETGKVSDFNSISVKGSIQPYVHENVAELMNILCQGVLSGSISVETASENVPYGAKDEFMRILNQTRRELIGNGNEQTGIDVNKAREVVSDNKTQ